MQLVSANSTRGEDRFATRLEAFSDLVFGFSLSLLATRLEVPSTPEQIFELSKMTALLITFVLICIMWMQHYRIFRHHFVPTPIPVITNFVFLFGLALLPYSLQTFMRFEKNPTAFCLYLGDLALIVVSLAVLQLAGLLRRDPHMDEAVRLRAWRRTVVQMTIGLALAMSVVLVALGIGRGITGEAYAGAALVVLVMRRLIRRVPRFLRPPAAAIPSA